MTNVEAKLRQENRQAGLQHDQAPVSDADPLFGSPTARYLISVTMTAVVTVLAVAIDAKVKIPNLSLIFVVPVIVAGLSLGLGPSLCAAILGPLAFNFFLTEPRYSLAVDDPANIWAIGLLFVVGLVISGVAFTSRQRATEAARFKRQAMILRSYSRNLLTADTTKVIVSQTCQTLAALFQAPAVVLLVMDGRVVSTERVGDLKPQDAELDAARSSLTTGIATRAGVYPDINSRFDFWPVLTTQDESAVIGVAFETDERPTAADAQVDIVRGAFALALERHHIKASPPLGS
jgi:two-component system sensor histidine kinase KdpD